MAAPRSSIADSLAKADDASTPDRSTAQPIRIVIIDELPIFRDGLRLLLGTDARLQIVGDIAAGPAAAALVDARRPDVLLLGDATSTGPCLEVLKQLVAAGGSVRTILLVKSVAAPEIAEALRIGACGFVARDSAPEVLFKSIDAVMQGDFWIGHERAPADLRAVLRQLDHAKQDAQRFRLTRRELEIVRGVVNGKTNQAIARRLGIAENTVKRHIVNIFNKVGASSRVELALFAAHHRLLERL